ncbi:uncharacterized protein FYW61_003426 isoform 1-T3 [Anableps anableps]
MGKGKDLSDFEKGQIVMARRLGQSISKTASIVGCSRAAVVSTFQKWSREGKLVNQRLGHGRRRLIDESGERRLAQLVQSNRKATVAQIAEEVNAGSDRKMSEWTVHRSLLRLGLRRRRGTRSRKDGGGRANEAFRPSVPDGPTEDSPALVGQGSDQEVRTESSGGTSEQTEEDPPGGN